MRLFLQGASMLTRQAAKQSIVYDKAQKYSYDSFVANIPQVASLIDAIYDSVEQRLCDNCTFDFCGCSVQDSILQIEPNATFDTFGCNSFESKEKPCVYVNPKNPF